MAVTCKLPEGGGLLRLLFFFCSVAGGGDAGGGGMVGPKTATCLWLTTGPGSMTAFTGTVREFRSRP
eukprot:m.431293 g.431293  ORF g.431293 m.431293 type:complete len:67 (-) comp20243_c3_seq4:390-590(-)